MTLISLLVWVLPEALYVRPDPRQGLTQMDPLLVARQKQAISHNTMTRFNLTLNCIDSPEAFVYDGLWSNSLDCGRGRCK